MINFWLEFSLCATFRLQCMWIEVARQMGVLLTTGPTQGLDLEKVECTACQLPMEYVPSTFGGSGRYRCPNCGLLKLPITDVRDSQRSQRSDVIAKQSVT
jgi:hypothetical protein